MAYQMDDMEKDDKKPYDEISQSVKDSISRKFQAPIREIGVESGTGMGPDDLEALKAQARQRQEAAMWSQALSPLSQLSKPVQDPGAFAKTLQAQAESDLDRAAKEELRREQVKQTIARNRESDALKREQMLTSSYEKALDREARKERAESDGLFKKAILDAKTNPLKNVTESSAEKIADLEKAEADLMEIAGMVKDDYVGPLDQYQPNVMTGPQESVFRAALGSYADAYRKAITGAGASVAEIAKLESRLPSLSDKPANFRAKAQEAINDIRQRRQKYLGALKSSGKNVEQFESAAPKNKEEIITDENGIQYVIQPDGSAIRRN